jgi:hypothetical protein
MLTVRPRDDTILLPGGLVLDEGCRICDATLRSLTGREEEWLAEHPTAPRSVVVTHLLTSCLVSLGDATVTSQLVRQLLVGDRDYLMLQLRCLTLGEDFYAVCTCPLCHSKMDVSFKARDLPVEVRPQVSTSQLLQFSRPQPDGRTIRYRLPTGGDQEALLGVDLDTAVDNLLDRCILDDDGTPVSPLERKELIDAMDASAPQVDPELELTCPECDHSFLARFDATAFFLDEIRALGNQLLREVHSLAFYYHWSEADILSLSRNRRRAYLALISDTVPQLYGG